VLVVGALIGALVSRRSFVLCCIAGALLSACSSAVAWHGFVRDPSFAPPKELRLVMFRSERARAQDSAGFVDIVVLTVQQDLRERGIEAEVVEARTSDYPPPRAELHFLDANEGSGAERWVTYGIAGTAGIELECRLVDASGKVTLSGRVRGEDHGEFTSGRGAAEAAGHAVAEALSDPKYEAPPPHFQKNGPPSP
jgi:hypothetical protein